MIREVIYLCGGINKLTDAQARDWREEAKSTLIGYYDFLDPMRRDYRGVERDHVNEIVCGDLLDIADSDIILVNAARPSWGTAMEVLYSSQRGKFVLIVCPDDHPSPWLISFSDVIVKDFKEACRLLKERAECQV